MTLGRTKSVDILVSNPKTGKMFKLEVKTNYKNRKSSGGVSRLFGEYVSAWIMNEKHEKLNDPDLFYCFVNISKEGGAFRFFIVPCKIVAKYVKRQHQIWLDDKPTHSRDNEMRTFRIGFEGKKYSLSTPTMEKYEDNWSFKK